MTASKDGIPIAYEVRGAGAPALVFVHGWSCDRRYWRGQLPHFGRRFKSVAVDLAGHGESGVGRDDWTMAAFGDDVAAVVAGLGLERVVLIGHSMGGDVVVEAARRLPGRVAGLIWVDVYSRLEQPRTSEQHQAFIAPFHANFAEATRSFVRRMFGSAADPVLVEEVVADMSSAPPAVALATIESARRFDREIPRALSELNLPIVAINPDARPTDVESLGRHGIDVLIMSGVGHFLMMEDPERFNPILEKAIDDLMARDRPAASS